jgi:hypothetical protein
MQCLNAVPSGDIIVDIQGEQSGGSDTLTVGQGYISARIMASSNGITVPPAAVANPLLASLKSTASMSCGATFPTTTCQATKSITPTVSGGKHPLTYANAVNSGPGAILSGATSSSYTIGDTETATTAGATHATVVQSKITTSETYTVTGATWTSGAATLTIGAGHSVVTGQTVKSSGNTPTGYNGTLLTITSTTSSAIKFAVASNPGAFSAGGTIDHVTTITNTCTVTGTFTLTYPSVSVSVTGSNAKCFANTNPNPCTAIASLTTNMTGGDGTPTVYANSVTAGLAGVLSGATTKNWTVGYNAATPFGPLNSTCQGQVTDGHSHAGTGSKVISFTGAALP